MRGRTNLRTARIVTTASRIHRRWGCVDLLGIYTDVRDAEDCDDPCYAMVGRDALETPDVDALGACVEIAYTTISRRDAIAHCGG